jgi:hypothetical protein
MSLGFLHIPATFTPFKHILSWSGLYRKNIWPCGGPWNLIPTTWYLASLIIMCYIGIKYFNNHSLTLSNLDTLKWCQDGAFPMLIWCLSITEIKITKSYFMMCSEYSKIFLWPCFPRFVNLFLTFRNHCAITKRVGYTKCEISFLYNQ